ncbi:hypothetical protein CROQUDRAFT_673154 [Cronartium quercuum f. sp. fusiforme G11]|uniref:Glucanase n=1 Tax=Cronartium quercuum f. sp. fusiforme G11 TaxID=708437 RepID=A0A9P6NCM3_9BASI|nr:hypothetical protein CROQUDRAFT_673154 [Cronartium quercuum f. sp. fusiforme G11]
MRNKLLPSLFMLFASTRGQQAGDKNPEVHPKLMVQRCTKAGGCVPAELSVTVDVNWRWVRKMSGMENCYKGNTWDAAVCTDPTKCSENCAVEGSDYEKTYGVTTKADALTLKFVTKGPYSTNVGSRLYLMASETKYEMFKLKNQEFSFDVDVSKLPCGLNGAVYFSEMEEDGGMSKYSGNKAGAKYGTGYCDAQCPHDLKFIGGKANVENWKPHPTNPNTGTGKMGACCAEMDIWEANSISSAYTPHTCSKPGLTICDGIECGDDPDNRYKGLCDKDGCDFQPFRLGARDYYGPGKTLDTKKKMTVITQFITSDGLATGELTEVRRSYVQDGKVIANAKTKVEGLKEFDSITKDFCKAYKPIFGDPDHFNDLGGLKTIGESMDRGQVLVLSLWNDWEAKMQWLDGKAYPPTKSPDKLGVARGTCDPSQGDPKSVEANFPDATVEYSNIRYGDIGSTHITNKIQA